MSAAESTHTVARSDRLGIGFRPGEGTSLIVVVLEQNGRAEAAGVHVGDNCEHIRVGLSASRAAAEVIEDHRTGIISFEDAIDIELVRTGERRTIVIPAPQPAAPSANPNANLADEHIAVDRMAGIDTQPSHTGNTPLTHAELVSASYSTSILQGPVARLEQGRDNCRPSHEASSAPPNNKSPGPGATEHVSPAVMTYERSYQDFLALRRRSESGSALGPGGGNANILSDYSADFYDSFQP